MATRKKKGKSPMSYLRDARRMAKRIQKSSKKIYDPTKRKLTYF